MLARFLVVTLSFIVSCAAGTAIAAPALADDAVSTYGKLRPSLALVAAFNSKKEVIGAGSAFCISSNASHSYFLTNRHVAPSDDLIYILKLEAHPDKPVVGHVIRRGELPLDAAIIETDSPNIPAVTLADELPRVGQSIAIAGYPFFQLEADRTFSPSYHQGTVNALIEGGYYIEHDAVQDHGNSGGPLFDMNSGAVYGLVTYGVQSPMSQAVQNNVAISIRQASQFFINANVTVTWESPAPAVSIAAAPASEPGILRNAPGAFRFVYANVVQSSPAAQPIADQLNNFLENQLGTLTGSLMIAGTLSDLNQHDFVQLCSQKNSVGVVAVAPSWTANGDEYSGTLGIGVFDCYGTVWYSAVKKETRSLSGGDAQRNYSTVILELAAEAIDDLRKQSDAYPTAVTNFARYGIPMTDGARNAFFTLTPSPSGAVVGAVSAYGTASRAGLQRGDLVVLFNGKPTAGLSQQDLTNLVVDEWKNDGTYELLISTADGKTTTLRFVPQDIRWYLTHPVTP